MGVDNVELYRSLYLQHCDPDAERLGQLAHLVVLPKVDKEHLDISFLTDPAQANLCPAHLELYDELPVQ